MSDLYPFTGKYWTTPDGLRLHYLDEGAGEAVVMLHGNPSWSFLYRNLVLGLRDGYRCLVPDQIGCGYSDKPREGEYPFTLQRRIDDFAGWIESLQLTEPFTLVVHDWGGMIGMSYAVQHPERIKRLVILNTAAFPLPAGKRLPRSVWWGRNTLIGTVLIRGFNAFCRGAARWGVVRKPMSAAVRAMFLKPYDSWAHRLAVLKFVQTIPLRPADDGYDIITATDAGLGQFRQTPTLICWGMQDFVFDGDFLQGWEKRLPEAEVHRFADAGHYLLEDAGAEVLALVQRFLS